MKEQDNTERDKQGMKVMITLIIIVVVVAGVIFFLRGLNKTDLGLETMACIAKNSSLYVSTGCSHCAAQEKDLGKYLGMFNITDCMVDTPICTELEISAVPTWVINNTQYSGVKSVEKLKELTGC